MTAKGEVSRERILHAAADVVGRHGYDGATISRISKEAGLPASSIYWFFRSKDHLVGEVVRLRFDEWFSVQPEWGVPAPGTPVGVALREILGQVFRSVLEGPEFLRVGQMLTLERGEPVARDTYLGLRDSILALIRLWLDDACAAAGHRRNARLVRELARVVLLCVDGLFLAVQLGSEVDVDTHADLTAAAVAAALGEG
ncbi:MAG TPA: TetR/AcrR family transcriptional regulator [Marmoricola sp.]|nr:TetR/AcrR family transcriptional regulator [Marmoricola sp.]